MLELVLGVTLSLPERTSYYIILVLDLRMVVVEYSARSKSRHVQNRDFSHSPRQIANI